MTSKVTSINWQIICDKCGRSRAAELEVKSTIMRAIAAEQRRLRAAGWIATDAHDGCPECCQKAAEPPDDQRILDAAIMLHFAWRVYRAQRDNAHYDFWNTAFERSQAHFIQAAENAVRRDRDDSVIDIFRRAAADFDFGYKPVDSPSTRDAE